MREILRKYWDRKMSLGINSSGDYPDLKNYDISEGNIKCEECTRQLWNDMTKKQLLKELHLSIRSLDKIYNEPGDCIFGGCK